MSMSASKPWVIVAGVGPGTGASVACKFGLTYSVAMLARNPTSYEPIVKKIETAGGKAIGISADASISKDVSDAFELLKREMGDAKLAAAIYNVGGSLNKRAFLELSPEDFESGWKLNGLGAFHFAQNALPMLLDATSLDHPPTLVFTSATAAIKGSALCASFSTGKFAMRSLSQSLAREFGPKGVHVAHAIIDGVIDAENTKDWLLDLPDAKINPNGIADAYWYLHTQPRTCFTNELDIRPYVEHW